MLSRACVALVTCAELPQLDEDTRLLAQALRARGIEAVPAVWSDAAIDWGTFDLAVVRTPWDYAARREEFVAWADRVPHLLNCAAALRWNTDKTYLRELAGHGVSVVPTHWLDPKRGQSPFSGRKKGQSPFSAWTAPRAGDWVVKPVISASAIDTTRYRLDDPVQRDAAMAHAQGLLEADRAVMIQPYQARIDTEGERSVIFCGGEYSHTVRKDAVLAGPPGPEDLRLIPGGGEGLRSLEPTKAEREVARRALEAVPKAFAPLLYARVDLVSGDEGQPLLMELEITEPELFLRMDPAAADRLAGGIAARLNRSA